MAAVTPASSAPTQHFLRLLKYVPLNAPDGVQHCFAELYSGTTLVVTSPIAYGMQRTPQWDAKMTCDGGIKSLRVIMISRNASPFLPSETIGNGTMTLGDADGTERTCDITAPESGEPVGTLHFAATNSKGVKPSPNKALYSSSCTDEAKEAIAEVMSTGADELDLSGQGFVALPHAASITRQIITEVNLGFNSFKDVPKLMEFTFLKIVDLSGNAIEVLDLAALAGLTHLRRLHLAGNALRALPADCTPLHALLHLDISNNKLQELPPAIRALTSLEDLLLHGNIIKAFPPEVSALQRLELLDASSCGLTDLPKELCLMTSLMDLDLGANALARLPANIGKLTRLAKLNVSDNKITDLPMSIGYCKMMSNLMLSGNPIKSKEMVKKYSIGTDHLMAYLEQRMEAFLMKKGVSPVDSPAKTTYVAAADVARGVQRADGTMEYMTMTSHQPDKLFKKTERQEVETVHSVAVPKMNASGEGQSIVYEDAVEARIKRDEKESDERDIMNIDLEESRKRVQEVVSKVASPQLSPKNSSTPARGSPATARQTGSPATARQTGSPATARQTATPAGSPAIQRAPPETGVALKQLSALPQLPQLGTDLADLERMRSSKKNQPKYDLIDPSFEETMVNPGQRPTRTQEEELLAQLPPPRINEEKVHKVRQMGVLQAHDLVCRTARLRTAVMEAGTIPFIVPIAQKIAALKPEMQGIKDNLDHVPPPPIAPAMSAGTERLLQLKYTVKTALDDVANVAREINTFLIKCNDARRVALVVKHTVAVNNGLEELKL